MGMGSGCGCGWGNVKARVFGQPSWAGGAPMKEALEDWARELHLVKLLHGCANVCRVAATLVIA
jgi:hypothetical protein